jgi:hypothetical protein
VKRRDSHRPTWFALVEHRECWLCLPTQLVQQARVADSLNTSDVATRGNDKEMLI